MTKPQHWNVILTDNFVAWLKQQNNAIQEDVTAALLLLKTVGPELSRPYADTLKGSQYPNMKELRIQHQGKPLRALFAFDPLRQAIILCAGDKSNDKQFYKRMIKQADAEFSAYLRTLEK
ncbi:MULTISPECIES: type II toxin-antitoxin system RelE/ParE family toxin [unclassified Avibacterium]|uniref:type II toxin-antitoxin system RelE/ParE family toxin n=1 Tax=unclassified Avibacterium TaxID=2685287 RepID=UPI00202738AF|nr:MULTISPECIES: type II toxin-antitoxin system RelE/ParE family toxin [unclassified Avibacterium]MCW9697960.1 type II toxin-antitoxin system RelE/ParE family toxin [Avibacterium sp. 20-129]MCW9733921.1 type II toxin-antitoxin system RelE/ParE family toxin [Avibacterium sp. 20-15]URL03922.1 type II toxin-antitoxin system RelE/ParE family toxin [Avibacterium sp. 20-132]URL05711.1 type II toxin-antitoxin system RelE/ParE family toxin [Avibacterium sp. 21-595]